MVLMYCGCYQCTGVVYCSPVEGHLDVLPSQFLAVRSKATRNSHVQVSH